jgi:hypothetical protein
MARVILSVMLAVVAAACSKHRGDAPAASSQTAAAPAGKVLEVAGAVTVGGRQLAVGDALSADDLVDTGSDGRVVIELEHNLAHWELGANKHEKVSDSIAWKLPRDEGNANFVIHDMSGH